MLSAFAPGAQPLTDRPRSAFRALLRTPSGVTGVVLVVFFVLLALTAPLLVALSGQDPLSYHLDTLDPSGVPLGFGGGISSTHWFGVEPLTGRDLFAIVVVGAQTSLFVGISAALLALTLGTVMGLSAGYFGGWWDTVVTRLIDVLLGFPSLIFMITLGAIVPVETDKTLLLIGIIGFFGWSGVARVVRAESMTLRQRTFVQASAAMGGNPLHIIGSQILPNLWPTIIVFGTLSIPAMIGAEAALSFLGVGVPPPTPAWGRSIGSAVAWVQTDPWFLLFPGLALFLVTLGFNLFGDALRDAIDPKGAR
ncbi:ABC transporter permease [Psychromicrobium sp. YIM B11713]|uniref:ABC transporter permease n=1 Tax=Psychromicrobium sp. YIM B11713 TaxID=3145233 RepID=UPI00374E35CE